MQDHWTAIGRQLSAETAGCSKAEKSVYLREAAHRMGFAPHTIGRFVVLVDFLDSLDVSEERAKLFPVGTVEVISRIFDRDRKVAENIIREFDRAKITYTKAYFILSGLGGKDKSSKTPISEVERARRVIGEYIFIGVEFENIQQIDRRDKRYGVIARGDSLWVHNDRYAAFISETYHVYAADRGIKNMLINAVLCSSEYDCVVVEFVDMKSRSRFFGLLNSLREDIKTRIIDAGVSDREISP